MKSVLSVFLYLRISTRIQLAAIQTIRRERSPCVCASPTVAKLRVATGIPIRGHAALGSLAAMSEALTVSSLLEVSLCSPSEGLGREYRQLCPLAWVTQNRHNGI